MRVLGTILAFCIRISILCYARHEERDVSPWHAQYFNVFHNCYPKVTLNY